MDITQRFKASVMAVKLQRKHELPQQALDKSRILPSRAAGNAQRDEFTRQAKDVCQKITTLRNVLLENRSAYMRIGQHLKSAAQMTDEQRDLIDRESEKFVAYYTQHLARMRTDWKRGKRKAQQQEHMEAVLDLLEAYLRSVERIYLEQKQYRVQHELETYRLLKLAADKKKIPVRPAGEPSGSRYRGHPSAAASNAEAEQLISDGSSSGGGGGGGSSDEDSSSDMDLNDGWQHVETKRKSKLKPKPKPKPKRAQRHHANGADSNDTKALAKAAPNVAVDEDIEKSHELDEGETEATKDISPEDVQMFEQENVQLLHELQGLSEEVERIEKNVVDIARLQDIFTEKISLQQHNIDRIANAVVGATENVKDANEQIKQAIQRNAGLRVWFLFFLLVMSFALLFLDWYYD